MAATTYRGLSKAQKIAVREDVERTLAKTVNSKVKDSVVKVKYAELCNEANKEFLRGAVPSPEAMTRPPPPILSHRGNQPDLSVGEYVEVLHEYKVGVCSAGGCGLVTLVGSRGGHIAATVKYILDGREEHGIELSRLTSVPFPMRAPMPCLRSSSGALQNSPESSSGGARVDVVAPLERLRRGIVRGKCARAGWLLVELRNSGELDTSKGSLRRRVLDDYALQQACIFGAKNVAGGADPLQERRKDPKTGVFLKSKEPNWLSKGYLAKAYGVHIDTLKRWVRASKKEGVHNLNKQARPRRKGSAIHGVSKNCVIEDREYAKFVYSPKAMYVDQMYTDWRNSTTEKWSSSEVYAMKKLWRSKWDDVVCKGPAARARYEKRAREHDERQPHIELELVDALRINSCRSWQGLSNCIGNWCGKMAIQRWLTSHPTYSMYKKNIYPGLTEENSRKQVHQFYRRC